MGRDQLGRRDQFGANRDVLSFENPTPRLGMLVRFMPIILGIWCDGSNKSEALLPEDMAKVEVVPITWCRNIQAHHLD